MGHVFIFLGQPSQTWVMYLLLLQFSLDLFFLSPSSPPAGSDANATAAMLNCTLNVCCIFSSFLLFTSARSRACHLWTHFARDVGLRFLIYLASFPLNYKTTTRTRGRMKERDGRMCIQKLIPKVVYLNIQARNLSPATYQILLKPKGYRIRMEISWSVCFHLRQIVLQLPTTSIKQFIYWYNNKQKKKTKKHYQLHPNMAALGCKTEGYFAHKYTFTYTLCLCEIKYRSHPEGSIIVKVSTIYLPGLVGDFYYSGRWLKVRNYSTNLD